MEWLEESTRAAEDDRDMKDEQQQNDGATMDTETE